MSKEKIISNLDNLIFACLVLYSLTFFTATPINFLVTAFILGIIKIVFYENKNFLEIHSKHLIFISLFILCTFITVCINTDASFSYYRSYYISPLVALLLPLLFSFTYKKIIILLTLISLIFFLNACYINYQFMQNIIIERPDGFFNGYMLLCGMNLLILPILLTLSIHKNNLPKYIRIFFFVTILVNIPAIIFENTRIVWVSLFIVFFIIIFLSINKKIYLLLIFSLLIITSYNIFQISPNSINRLQTISSTNSNVQQNYERILMWHSALNMFIEHPITGIGIGNYHKEYVSHYRSPLSKEDTWHPHNVLLSMLAQSGLIGTIGYLLLFIYLYYKSISNYIKDKNIIDLTFLSSLLAFSLNGLTDCNFVGHNLKELTYMFYFITGMYLVCKKYIINKN
ncbi:O-antigen ligase family protein [uncultured Megamonas sp.]|uniref:O-antigen ligase family protein n=1 Tax=uncultured Megamonas sp. TaxID=286140 RepID=UPI00259B64EF|nr:O-antigen ligase family protein [uncultured Megamonas sp.]